jgi:hypothetical protein
MIYRISIVFPADHEPGFSPEECVQKVIASLTWSLEAVLCMESLGLPAPKKFANVKAHFYFTQFGWNQIGRHVAAELQRHKYEIRVQREKHPSLSQIAYKDVYQVALLPPSEKRRKHRKKQDQTKQDDQ